tara:strand:- start:233 stop:466 length:234 start_codon:yes stop_codon:yes gene_type:complete
MSVKNDLRDPNSLTYKCSKVSLLIDRFGYRRKNEKDIIKKLCAGFGITVKQLENYEKEYWANINKVHETVKKGLFDV